jgi:hypothetical protein
MKEEQWKRNDGGVNMDDESCHRDHGAGARAEES